MAGFVPAICAFADQ